MSKDINKIYISIIIPAKDEEKRLPVFLNQIIYYVERSSLRHEIIVVNDGSSDGTADCVASLVLKHPFMQLLNLNENKGKGFAVRYGFEHADGEILLFLDADGSTSPDEIEKNIHYFQQGYDIVVGSRVKKSNEVIRKKRFFRRAIGFIFNFLVHAFLFRNIEDSQCGFKMFRKECAQSLFKNMRIEGFGFDMEILYLAQKSGYKIIEAPINWRHVAGSKVNVFFDSFRMFINMLQIRRWYSQK